MKTKYDDSGWRKRLDAAKQQLRIPRLWRLLDLPHAPQWRITGVFHSPFRIDRRPSFSIFADGRAFCDHASGQKGDAVEFLRLATNLRGRALLDRFSALSGVSLPSSFASSVPMARSELPHPTRHAPIKSGTFTLPPLQRPTLSDLRAISGLRNLSLEGLGLAVERGFLRVGHVRGHRCFVVAEPDQRTAAARRLDGKLFRGRDGSEYKSHSLTPKQWPLGISVLPTTPDPDGSIMLCEGETDFLAAFNFAAVWGEPKIYPIAFLGRTLSLHPDIGSTLRGWRIRAFPHADADGGGLAAVRRWASMIPSARADAFDFRGLLRQDSSPVNDLNDAVALCAANAPALDEMNPLPVRHPCNDASRVELDYSNRFRIHFWNRIQTMTPEGWPVVDGAACPF